MMFSERKKETKKQRWKSPPLFGFERMGWLWVDFSSIGISLIPVHFLLYRWTDFNSFQDHPWRTNSSLTAHDYVLNKQQHPPLPVYLLYMWTGFRSLMPYFSMMIDWCLWGKAATLWLQRARFTRGEKDWRKAMTLTQRDIGLEPPFRKLQLFRGQAAALRCKYGNSCCVFHIVDGNSFQ